MFKLFIVKFLSRVNMLQLNLKEDIWNINFLPLGSYCFSVRPGSYFFMGIDIGKFASRYFIYNLYLGNGSCVLSRIYFIFF